MKTVVAALALSAGLAAPVLADVVTFTPHSHDPSPVTTWGTGPNGQHQHRTPHDPAAGVYSHIGNGNAYVATKVWTDRVQHAVAGGHNPFAHGHQDVAARWAIHQGTDAGAFPANIANAALDRTADAFSTWMGVGNGSEFNYPGTDVDIGQPYPAPNSIQIHRTLLWDRVNENTAHEVHVTWDNAGLTGRTYAAYFPTLQTIRVNTTMPWYFGTSTDPAVNPHDYDFLSVITHEVGHVVGLGHFGALGTHIMTDAGDQPFRDGHFFATHGHAGGSAHLAGDAHAIPAPTALELAAAMFRTVDLDAEHGVRDLYSIPGLIPAPGTAALLGLSGLLTLRRRRA